MYLLVRCLWSQICVLWFSVTLFQKLSIYGDLEYLRDVNDKVLLSGLFKPQEPYQKAEPLPIKVKVQRI